MLPHNPVEVHLHTGQCVAQLIVQLSRDPKAFSFGGSLRSGSQRAQLIFRPTQLIFSLLPLRNVVSDSNKADWPSVIGDYSSARDFKPTHLIVWPNDPVFDMQALTSYQRSELFFDQPAILRMAHAQHVYSLRLRTVVGQAI
jgi:hypothetical protein